MGINSWQKKKKKKKKERRAKLKVTTFYKILNNLLHVSNNDPILVNTSRRLFNYNVPQSRLNIHLHSFIPSTIRLWNSLPGRTKASAALNEFKSSIRNHNFFSFFFFFFLYLSRQTHHRVLLDDWLWLPMWCYG